MITYLTGIQNHEEIRRMRDILEAQGHEVSDCLTITDDEHTPEENAIIRVQAVVDLPNGAQVIAPQRDHHLSDYHRGVLHQELSAARRIGTRIIWAEAFKMQMRETA